jgi:hypothetical protein
MWINRSSAVDAVKPNIHSLFALQEHIAVLIHARNYRDIKGSIKLQADSLSTSMLMTEMITIMIDSVVEEHN